MLLPGIGDQVLAYVPTLRRSIAVGVTAYRGTKFWGVDDSGNLWTGLSQWDPLDESAENSAPSADEDEDDVTGEYEGEDDVTGEDEGEDDVTGEDEVSAENSAPLGDTGADEDEDDVIGEDGVSAENSAHLGGVGEDEDDVTGEDDDRSDFGSLIPPGATESGIIDIPVKFIRTDEAFQPRSHLDDFTIERYSSMLAYSDPPPVELWWIDDDGGGALWLVHGHHRLSAVRRAGRSVIPAIVKKGGRSAAIRAAMIANLSNGLALSRQSLEAACKKYLAASPISESSRSVARLFGIDEKTVRNYRKDLEVEQIISRWQPGVTRLLLVGGSDDDRSFYLGTYKGRCYGGDNRWSVQVEFDSQRVNQTGPYPVSRLHCVDDPRPGKPDFHLGDRCWHPQYGYGFIFYDPPADRDSLRQLGLLRGVGWQACFFPEWSGRFASAPLSSLEFVALGEGLNLGRILLSLRQAIAQISDDMSPSEADRLHSYLNARIEWVKLLVVAAAGAGGGDYLPVADDDADNDYLPAADDDADDDYLPAADDDADDDYLPAADDDADDDYLPAADDDADDDYLPAADDDADDLDAQLALFLDFLPTFLAEADRTHVYRLLRDSADELRRRGVSNTVLIQCIRSNFHPLAG